MRTRSSLLLLTLLGLLACGTEPRALPAAQRQGIVNGSPDATDTAVKALLVQQADGSAYLCTGSAIGPHTLLTAAHCVAPFSATSRGVVVDTEDALQGLHTPGAHASVDAVRPHPDYAERPSGDWNDIGLVHTVEAMAGPYLPLNRYPLDRLVFDGESVREVGYGETSADGGTSGIRREVTKSDVSVASSRELQEGPLTGLTCSGDSGGPALFVTPDGQESVVGVASRGDVACEKLGISTRVDPYLTFIDDFMADQGDAPSCQADGRCASHCAAPDPDCPCAPDGLCTSACATPAADPDCPQSCLFDGGSCIPPVVVPPAPRSSKRGGGCGSGSGSALASLMVLAGMAARRRRAL